jgi:hypothetical protein
MASGSHISESDRHASHHNTGLENFLPTGGSKMDRPLSTPLMERSTSMTESFILEHIKHQGPGTPGVEGTDSYPGTPRMKEDGLTPISNWAHLSFIKNQRNHLRAELKAHQIAGAEAKQSITSLRRLAFRMAVNISVKERQIATTARNLTSSRKKHYLSTRDAEKRIEQLSKSLEEEEYRNKDILECLEKASRLTLQCKHPSLGATGSTNRLARC